MSKRTKPTSKFPKPIQRMIASSHRKGLETSSELAERINNSKTAMRLGVSYSTRQIATTKGNITRQHCSWA